jgi:hypothetical protein
MLKSFTKESESSIAFGDLPSGGHDSKEDVGPMDIPQADEFQSHSLIDNTIFLAKKSEMVFESNLIVVGGLPCNFSLNAIYEAVLTTGRLLNHIHSLNIDLVELESFLNDSNREQIILYSDGRTCSFTLTIPSTVTFAMGGHNRHPAAFGVCSTKHVPFEFTCQAIPIPATFASLKGASELAVFRGIPLHEAECQCVTSLISDRISTVYAHKLNMDPSSFDVILHRRRSSGHCHSDKDQLPINYVGVYIRPGNQTIPSIKYQLGIKQGPNPVFSNWIGEVWEDYSMLRVMPPSRILLDHTPATHLSGFGLGPTSIDVLITALLADNPAFLLHEAAYIWLESIDDKKCTMHIVWKRKYISVSVSSNLKAINLGADVLINISSNDNRNMSEVRYSVACSIAHFHMISEQMECDFDDKRKREQFKNLVAGMLKPKPGVICPLRIIHTTVPVEVPPITSITPDRTTSRTNAWTIPAVLPTTVTSVPMVVSGPLSLSSSTVPSSPDTLTHDAIKALILSTLQLELSQRELTPSPIETQILTEIAAINKREDTTSSYISEMREVTAQSLLLLHGMGAHLERSNKILLAVEASSVAKTIEAPLIIATEPPPAAVVMAPKFPDIIFTGRQSKNNKRGLSQSQMVLDYQPTSSSISGTPFLHTSVAEEDLVIQQLESVTAPESSVNRPPPPNE